MKKTITNFRLFARERRKAKLLKSKIASFVVKYQKGAHPELENVTANVTQAAAIFFYDSTNEPLFFL